MDDIRHLTLEELQQGIGHVAGAAASGGALEAIVVRPEKRQRLELETATLTPEMGVEGDNWARDCGRRLEDGSADPNLQLTIMNSRATALITQHRSRWPLAGDQLYAELDTGVQNLPVGQRLQIGSVVVEITDEPHLGCAMFAQRFGNDALRFVNEEEGRALRLRGVYGKVVEAGTVTVGDTIDKI